MSLPWHRPAQVRRQPTVSVLQRTDATTKDTQALILSPTRELCLQIADDLNSFAKYIPHMHIIPVYGGASIGTQINELRHGAQIIVATRAVSSTSWSVAR